MIDLIRKLQNEISDYTELEQKKGFFEVEDIQILIDEYIYLIYEIRRIDKITEKVKKVLGDIDEF